MDDKRLLLIAGIGCGPPSLGTRMRMRVLESGEGLDID
jgi:hypothetical protein